jgi:signal transduction histidine kinase/CheY-like chemotaxis protein
MRPNRLPLPQSPEDLRDRLLWRVAHLGSALSAAVILGFTSFYALSGQWALVAIEGLALGVIVGCYAWALRTRRPTVAVHGLAGGNWAVLIVVVVMQGGLTSPGITWLVLLPPLAMLAGSPWAWPMAALTVTLMFGLYAAQSEGILPPPAEIAPLQRAISASLIVMMVSLFAFYALRWRTRLADELATARDAAIEANRLKDRFIAHLNHEIRTPMNALIASAELLAARTTADPGNQPLVSALRESAGHLRALVDDVLDLARLEAGAMPLEVRPFELPALIDSVHHMFAPAAVQKGLRLSARVAPGTPSGWSGDALRIRQVLLNLVSNAIKMTETGGVDLRVAAGADAGLLFEVQDSGPGIPPPLRERLFAPYAQGRLSAEQRPHSSGLGLAICRELVIAMGGHIDVDAAPGGGTVFRVALPLARDVLAHPVTARSDPLPRDGPQRGGADTVGGRVLLVEDDEVNRLVMATLLKDMGVDAVPAPDGASALARLQSEPFDAVLMDCQLPDLDGTEVTRRWRAFEADQACRRIPVIAVTGNVDAESRASCLASGMDLVIGKPISRDALARALAATRSARGAARPDPPSDDRIVTAA